MFKYLYWTITEKSLNSKLPRGLDTLFTHILISYRGVGLLKVVDLIVLLSIPITDGMI